MRASAARGVRKLDITDISEAAPVSAIKVFYGYLVGAVLMVAAAIVELALGLRNALENVATPLSAAEVGVSVLIASRYRTRETDAASALVASALLSTVTAPFLI